MTTKDKPDGSGTAHNPTIVTVNDTAEKQKEPRDGVDK